MPGQPRQRAAVRSSDGPPPRTRGTMVIEWRSRFFDLGRVVLPSSEEHAGWTQTMVHNRSAKKSIISRDGKFNEMTPLFRQHKGVSYQGFHRSFMGYTLELSTFKNMYISRKITLFWQVTTPPCDLPCLSSPPSPLPWPQPPPPPFPLSHLLHLFHCKFYLPARLHPLRPSVAQQRAALWRCLPPRWWSGMSRTAGERFQFKKKKKRGCLCHFFLHFKADKQNEFD